MAEAVSDREQSAAKFPAKRRRILDPSAIVSVPVYSNKVSSCLQLKPTAAMFSEKESSDDSADDSLWLEFSSRRPAATIPSLSDSEEDETEAAEKQTPPVAVCCPSPPESPVRTQSRQVQNKISEINQKLQAARALVSPEPQDRKSTIELDDDDVIIMSPSSEPPSSSPGHEIPLKIRCWPDIHKFPVLSSTPLSDVVTRLSVTLKVPPPCLLLMREEVELPTDSTVGELGLSIADIIECVVVATEDNSASDIITVRLQSKDRDCSQKFSLHRDAPLGSVFAQYRSSMSTEAQKKVKFHFDGCRVRDRQTPAQLDMEDGDIIEVWT